MTLGERIVYDAQQGIEHTFVYHDARQELEVTSTSKYAHPQRTRYDVCLLSRKCIDEVLEDTLYRHSLRLNNFRTEAKHGTTDNKA
jgi:hypothetical protein